jgi:hypothetical protein
VTLQDLSSGLPGLYYYVVHHAQYRREGDQEKRGRLRHGLKRNQARYDHGLPSFGDSQIYESIVGEFQITECTSVKYFF